MRLKNCFLFLTIFTWLGFAQTETQQNKIYDALEAFVANPKPEKIHLLDKIEADFYSNKSIKTSDDLLAIVILNCNKAYYLNQFGQIEKAIATYEKAWQLFDKKCSANSKKTFDISENCLQKLGNLYTIIGDYNNAENTIKQYYSIAFANKNTVVTNAAILNLAIVQQQSGNIESSTDMLKGMLNSNQLNANETANYKSVLASNYLLLNKNDKAEKEILATINILLKQKNNTTQLATCYRNLSSVYFQKKNYQLAAAYFETALKNISETVGFGKHEEAAVFYEYAVLLYKMKNNTKANEYINRATDNLIDGFRNQNADLPNQKQLFADNVLLDIIELKASIYTSENRFDKALEAYKLCDYIDDLFNNLLVHENAKIINQMRVRNRVEKCIAIYDKLYQSTKKIIYLEKAFLLSEKTKSGVLKNYLNKIKTASREELYLQEQLQNTANLILIEQQKVNYADLERINDLTIQQNQIMLKIKSIKKANVQIGENNLDLAQLFEKLKKDKASMIEYFVGQETIYSFALSENKIVLNSFENSEINKNKIIKFINFFATSDAISNDISGYNVAANAVYNILNIPKKENKNLIIIPDGLLNFVPFEALITKTSTTTNFAKMNYLINDFSIGYNNSASFYLSANSLSNKDSVLGIFPVFEKTDYELTFSKTELKNIKKNFEGQFYENTNANFQNFKNNANQFSILHLSTHADAGDVEFPATIKFFDRDVLYSELYNLNINPDLVVLSACQTGIGKLYKSEGAMSIARGFQFAGAQNLLLSLWKVNDFTTSVFMSDFYKNIKNKMSFFEANQQAKKDFLADKTISNTKKSPYYWSAFVYYGTLEKPEPNYLYWILAGISILLTSSILFIQIKKYRLRKQLKTS